MQERLTSSARRLTLSARAWWINLRSRLPAANSWLKVVLGLVLLYFTLTILLGAYWSLEPDLLDMKQIVQEEVPLDTQRTYTGVNTTVALIRVSETLLEKRGGYIANDLSPPGIWLDNIPNWEYGVLIQVRDASKAMREAFSRSQSQSTEDKDLAAAENKFNFDHNSWMIPSTEGTYREGLQYLRNYLDRLVDEQKHTAQFYARSDNLRYWLNTVETRLGSLSQRLSASIGQRRLNTDLAGDSSAQQATQAPSELEVKTPWLEIDDVFYEARGSAWALVHLLKAVQVDFADVLEKKNAVVSLRQIIRELEGTQQGVFPIILNGSGFGMLANHSLVMANYISRANAAIIDLRELLAQG